jgi:6-phosphogluconolactonase
MAPDVVVADRAEIQRLVVSTFTEAADGAIAARGAFRLVIAGGSIAELFFPSLSRVPVDWSRVDFFWADERAVPPEHPDSNYFEANRLWLQPAGVPADRIHRMRGEDPDLQHAATTYATELSRVAGEPPLLDFALIGFGPDGHIASLFPAHPSLNEMHTTVLAIEDAPKPPPRRITLALPVLAGADRLLVAASGTEKAEVVRRALEPGSELPLGRLLARARASRVLLVK